MVHSPLDPSLPALPIVPRGTPPLVLVIEDDAALRDLIVESLRELGCDTQADGDANAIGRRFEGEEVPDLLITDVRLPGIDGIAALGLLRRMGVLVPALVMTAFPSDELRNRMRGLDVARLIEKPLDPEDLVAAILQILPVLRGEVLP